MREHEARSMCIDPIKKKPLGNSRNAASAMDHVAEKSGVDCRLKRIAQGHV
jgi:hypothetical protein